MDLKKLKKGNKVVLIFIALLLVIVFVILAALFLRKEDKEVAILDYKIVQNMYQSSEVDSCTDIVDSENSTILFLIFGQMKKDKVLNDKISLSTYKSEAKKVINVSDLPVVSGYRYDGFSYTLSGDEITREKVTCPEKSYVSKLFGYSSGSDTLHLTIASGYVKNGVIYDMDGNELGNYNKSELNKLLDKATLTNYKFIFKNNNYKFEEIEK